MERGDKVEDQAQDESSDEAVYEKYTDSNGKKRLRRVPVDTARIKGKPKKNKQRMADASQYNQYNEDEEEMDEVQEASPMKQRKGPKQRQQRRITRERRSLQDEKDLGDAAPINLVTPYQINQVQPSHRQHRYKELQSRVGDIEDDYDNSNLTAKERRDIANRRLRMLSEKEIDERQRLMAEDGQRNVEDPAHEEITRERKSLREKMREKFAKTKEVKSEDAQTDRSDVKLRTENEEIALEDNVRITAEVRQSTKPQRKNTMQNQDAQISEPASTNADDDKPNASPLTVATEELRHGEIQENPKEREIDPRLNLLASRRPGQIADPPRKCSA